LEHAIRVISDKCTGCALCLKECPIGVIRLIEVNGNKKALIKEECNCCGACVNICSFNAIELFKIVREGLEK